MDIFYIKVDIFYVNNPNKVDIFYVSERIKWTSSTQSDWADYGRFFRGIPMFFHYIYLLIVNIVDNLLYNESFFSAKNI